MEASISTGRSPLTSRRSRVRSVEVPLVQTSKQNLFRLVEEPNERQRKSYEKESRLMSPSPLTIAPVSPLSLPYGIQGVVSVRLVSESGSDEDDSILEGQKTVCLNSERKAEFSLKVVKNSKKKFRLKFTVNVQYNGQSYSENIFSLPFGIITTKKNVTRKPEVLNMHLRYGLCDRENEVWIKGKNFSARNTMEVMFGDKQANILETDDNIIICLAPTIAVEPGKEKQVEVKVCNLDSKYGRFEADHSLIFTFCGPVVSQIQIKDEPMFQWNMEANQFFNQYPS